MLHFDSDYFKEETRKVGKDEFTIPAFMKHAWAAQLEMLNKVDTICRENDITYYGNWGTLLGAVRHKGYIPWDDDIDLCMFRDDLMKFCEVIDNYNGIEIHTPFNFAEHGFHAYRVMNSTFFTVERNVYKEYHGFPFPSGLDIFNLDYVPRDKALEEEQVEAVQVCSTAAHAREWLDEHREGEKGYSEQFAEYVAAVNWLEKNCGVTFSQQYPDFQEIVILKEEIAGLYHFDDADYVTEMQCLGNNMNYYIPKDVFESTVRLPFENTTIPAPVGYNDILRDKYGDSYMTPRNVAAGHDYPFYNTLIRAIYDERKHKNFEGACEYIEDISSRYYVKWLNKKAAPRLGDAAGDSDVSAKAARELSEEDAKTLAAQCEVLEEFKRLCDIAHITYYAIGDTLSAAKLCVDKRADGEVSEDEDAAELQTSYQAICEGGISVAIKREDLNEFLGVLGRKLDPWFNYSCLYSSNEHEDMRVRIWSDSYLCDEKEFAERFHGCKKEVSLYISVIDLVMPDAEKDSVRKMLIENLITTSRSMPDTPPYSDDVLSIVDEWQRIAHVTVNTEKNLRREFLRAADNIAGAAADEGVTNVRISAGLQFGKDTVYPRNDFAGYEEVPFYITTIRIPKTLEARDGRREVVFLPYKASMWDSLESAYMDVKNDKSVNAIVVPIPYYDKNPDGSTDKEHYEYAEFPNDVPVIDYRCYDIAARHPDKIYIHNPYDEFNHITTVQPDYYSEKLREYTDELIYIPYFVLADIDPNNKDALEGVKHLIITNVMKNAHKVIVWSKDWRQAYINVMSDFAGENTRKYWEQIIKVEESSKLKRVRDFKVSDMILPDDWKCKCTKPDGSKKKIILYNTSVGTLLEESEKMIDKIDRVLGFFRENKDEVTLLWRPHPLMEATLTSMRPDLWESFSKLTDTYRREDWGIFDESADIDRAIAVSDAYYGDQSSVVMMYQETHKPIMIQNCEC